jgi:hypothetical protein
LTSTLAFWTAHFCEDSIESSHDSQQENSSLTPTSDENTHKSSADVTEEPAQKKEKKDEKIITDV